MNHIVVEAVNEIALVRIDRPPANALDLVLVSEITAVSRDLAETAPGAVVLTGREGFFSAGLDLKTVPTLEADQQRELIAGVNGMVEAWYGFPRPVVCAVNGHAIAGGLVLALCADYRVGSATGKLGLTEVRAGIPFPAAAMEVVRAELTAPAARLLSLAADLLDPVQALELGLLDEIADPDGGLDRALTVAGELAALPSDVYARVKAQLRGRVISEIARIVHEHADPLLDSWLAEETRAAASTVLRGTS